MEGSPYAPTVTPPTPVRSRKAVWTRRLIYVAIIASMGAGSYWVAARTIWKREEASRFAEGLYRMPVRDWEQQQSAAAVNPAPSEGELPPPTSSPN